LIAHHVNEELWHIFHNELDLDGNGQIDEQELQNALSKSGKYIALVSCSVCILILSASGIRPPPSTIADFMASVSTIEHSPHITFDEFRNFFILLPRKISPAEIYKYYEMRKYMGDDGRGAARVNMEGNYL
jgi:solute carrier family 25 phosphate transporter 23/24/25/41